MLKTILSTFALGLTLTSLAQWEGTLTPAVYHHYSIASISDDILLAGGYGGSLVRTTNGGDSWQSVSIGTTDWVQAIQFTDNNTGWLACHPGDLSNGAIMKSTDAGLTWSAVKTDHNYSSMAWPSASVGYVGTWEGVIVKTSDGGATWTELTTPSTDNIPYLFFLDNQNGFAADNNNKFFRTNDGGATWESFTHQGIHEFFFFDVNKGYCVDAYGRVGTTTDGGETFSYWTSPYVSYKLHDITFYNDQVGYIIGGLDCTSGDCITKPVILRTNDGGATWTDDDNHPYLGQDIGFYAIAVTPDGTPFLAGSDRIILRNEALAAGVNELQAGTFALYPNPATTELNITGDVSLSGHTLRLTDVSGNVLLEQEVSGIATSLPVGELAPGLYFVHDNASGTIGQFMKQ